MAAHICNTHTGEVESLEHIVQPDKRNQWAPGSVGDPVTKQGSQWLRKMLDVNLWLLTSTCVSAYKHINMQTLMYYQPFHTAVLLNNMQTLKDFCLPAGGRDGRDQATTLLLRLEDSF